MAQFDFPSSPSTNQTYTSNSITFKWDGVAWRRITSTGAQGNAGAQGAQGYQGSGGTPGAQGASAAGAQGAQGYQGAAGAQGDDASLVSGINPPGSPSSGDLWWDSDEGDLLVYFNDKDGII